MASLSKHSGSWRIQFASSDRKRQTLRLGKVARKDAEAFKLRVERLIACQRAGTPLDAQTAAWVGELPDEIHDRLFRVGLVEAREESIERKLGELVAEFLSTLGVKAATLTRYQQTADKLLGYFGEDAALSTLGAYEADDWRAALTEDGYAAATIAKDVSIARTIFRQALRWGWADSNPFEDVKAGGQTNRARMHYVSPEDARRLLDAAPNADWRCVIALARWGGMRCPSEVLRARWSDIDWDRGSIRVTSPKTAGSGKADRMTPQFSRTPRHPARRV
ncbi:MAG: hypothetical protein AAGA55_03145 [Planctomycetota bacterium]